MNKIGISTVFTGYNYGSALQAFATCKIVESLGFNSELMGLIGSVVKGRDVRIGKLCALAFKTLTHPSNLKNNINTYHSTMTKPIPAESVQKFDEFTQQYLNPVRYSMQELRHKAKTTEYFAFICGSDQIWNSSTYYVDPFYYLRFAPINKRVSFAPSFGRNYVPEYNWNKIKKYVGEVPFRSVRETSAVDIIEKMTGEKPTVLIDPTLILNANEWIESLDLSVNAPAEQVPYILAYFLDRPNDHAMGYVKQLAKFTGFRVIGIPYEFEGYNYCDEIVSAGPREFVELIRKAAVVCTDSFHGTAFSMNFHVPFYTFDRNYGSAEKQSTRIVSLLQLTGMLDRLNPKAFSSSYHCDFTESSMVLQNIGMKAKEYLMTSFRQIKENVPK